MVKPQFKIFEFLTAKNALQKETSPLFRPLIFYVKKREKGRKKEKQILEVGWKFNENILQKDVSICLQI